MQLGITPILNSPQKIRQKQPAFGAYTYTGELDTIKPILEKAKLAGINIYTPDEIMQTVRKMFPPDKDNELQEMLADELKNLIKGYLFSAKEEYDIRCTAMISALRPTIDKAREICANLTSLPLKQLETIIEGAEIS